MVSKTIPPDKNQRREGRKTKGKHTRMEIPCGKRDRVMSSSLQCAAHFMNNKWYEGSVASTDYHQQGEDNGVFIGNVLIRVVERNIMLWHGPISQYKEDDDVLWQQRCAGIYYYL